MRKYGFSSIGMIALAVVAMLGTGCKRGKEQAELPPASGEGAPPRAELPPLLPSQTAEETVATASAQQTTGTTFPRESAQVAPSMSGIIAKIDVKEGDQVKKGQVLFRLRADDMALRVSQAQVGLKTAQVNLDATRVEYERTQRLLEKNAVNQASWDRVRAQYDAAQTGVEQAKVALALARKMQGDAVVRSPINGVVTHKLKSEGEMATMMPPTPVVIVEDHSVLELRFKLPERYLGEIKNGQMVNAEFAALGVSRQAKVLRISPGVDPMTRTFEVFAEIPNQDGQLKSGMLAKVDIEAMQEAPTPEDKTPGDKAPAGKAPAGKSPDSKSPEQGGEAKSAKAQSPAQSPEVKP